MMRESDRCLVISVEVVAIVALWALGTALAAWGTLGDGPPHVAEVWAVLVVCCAATSTVAHRMTRYHRLLRQAFELGREAGRGEVTPLRR